MPGIHIAMLILDQPDIHPIKWSMVFTRKENNINVKKKVYMSMKKLWIVLQVYVCYCW